MNHIPPIKETYTRNGVNYELFLSEPHYNSNQYGYHVYMCDDKTRKFGIETDISKVLYDSTDYKAHLADELDAARALAMREEFNNYYTG